MGKNTMDLDKKSFDAFVKKGICVIDFWAAWCGPCKMMEPIFDEVAEEMKGKVNFGRVDVDSNYELAQKFKVMSIPTTIFFKDGEIVDHDVGVVSKKELMKKIKEIK